MMLQDEQERGSTYDWVLSLRIDSVALEGKNKTDVAPVPATSKWLHTSINAILAAPPGTVLVYQDFVWFADRPTALSMAADARAGTDRAFETRPHNDAALTRRRRGDDAATTRRRRRRGDAATPPHLRGGLRRRRGARRGYSEGRPNPVELVIEAGSFA